MNLDKTILVTGASSGIGKAIAILLSNNNFNVVITGRNQERLNDTFKALKPGNHKEVVSDLSLEDGLNELVTSTGVVHGIVFCAGAAEYLPIKFLTSEKIRKIFDINFESQVLLTQKMLKAKKVAKGGSLVYISSLSSKLGVAGTAMYAASKAALSSFAKVLATELAGQRIRVNAVSPGIIKTPMTQSENLGVSETDLKNDEEKYPLGHGNVDDVASYVAFLMSESSTWITGSDLVMDGGFTLN